MQTLACRASVNTGMSCECVSRHSFDWSCQCNFKMATGMSVRNSACGTSTREYCSVPIWRLEHGRKHWSEMGTVKSNGNSDTDSMLFCATVVA